MKIQKRKPTADSEKLEKAHKAPDNKTVKADPLHGVKLLDMLNYLVDKYGWFEMSKKINIRCFKFDPSIKSSLHFLRRTPWARTEVEQWYKSEH